MKLFVFDTETTGLPTKYANIEDNLEGWPHIVQLSFMIYDTDETKLLYVYDRIIKIPSSVSISKESEDIHNITREVCDERGVDIREALTVFEHKLKECDIKVGHNISFDEKMIRVEKLRLNWDSDNSITRVENKLSFCTMKKGADICELTKKYANGRVYPKYPKLSELHFKLFGELPLNCHNSLYDINITLRCYLFMEHKYLYNIQVSDMTIS
uniref:Exonuclease domain-containing protein n=1 Tax=viral metagenome TaxID=1070528 RepID=A0A6C0HP58_9ZZZZ